jgi:hypothetical protein
MEPIPPELMEQIKQHEQAKAAAAMMDHQPALPSGFPPGMSYSDYMNLPPEDQLNIH